MPPPRTFSLKIALILLRSHLGFSLRRLLANALTAAVAPPFQAALAEWETVFHTELELNDAIDDAQVVVFEVDQRLNRFADRVSKEILTITGDNREDVLYTHHFDKPLHAFKRPTLGSQLSAMAKWPTSLAGSGHASLQAMVPELIPLLAEAEAAAKAKTIAEDQRNEFRDIGARRKLIDRVNAVRKEAYGVLSTLPHKHTGLVSNFADQFFRRDTTPGEVEEGPTIETVNEKIAALRTDLAAAEKLLKELDDAAKEAAAKAQERGAARSRLAQLEQEMADKKKEADALRAEIGPDED